MQVGVLTNNELSEQSVLLCGSTATGWLSACQRHNWTNNDMRNGRGPGSWVYRVPKSTQQFVDRVREHLRLVVAFYNFLKTFQDYSWHFSMWKRSVCQATGESDATDATVAVSQISKQSARYKTKSNRWKWNTYLQYASTMENSAGNVREYLSGIDIEQVVNKQAQVGEGMWVSIHYLCLLYAIGYQSCSTYRESPMSNFVCLSTATTAGSFPLKLANGQSWLHFAVLQGVNFAVTL